MLAGSQLVWSLHTAFTIEKLCDPSQVICLLLVWDYAFIQGYLHTQKIDGGPGFSHWHMLSL